MLENVLGEPVEWEQGAWAIAQRLGFPVYMRSKKDGNTPSGLILGDFAKKEYNGGYVSIDAFKEVVKDSNVDYSYDLYTKWRKDRIKHFRTLYTPQRDFINQMSEKKYKKKVNAIWGQAQDHATRVNGIVDLSVSSGPFED